MRHDQPVSGMTILWGLTKQGDVTMKGEHSTYLALLDFLFFGRTQIWIREG
jgi:hypothetical protein